MKGDVFFILALGSIATDLDLWSEVGGVAGLLPKFPDYLEIIFDG